jgi:hypothetical protein
MLRRLTTDLSAAPDVTVVTARRKAMKLLWLDIIVTCAVLAAVASQL